MIEVSFVLLWDFFTFCRKDEGEGGHSHPLVDAASGCLSPDVICCHCLCWWCWSLQISQFRGKSQLSISSLQPTSLRECSQLSYWVILVSEITRNCCFLKWAMGFFSPITICHLCHPWLALSHRIPPKTQISHSHVSPWLVCLQQQLTFTVCWLMLQLSVLIS